MRAEITEKDGRVFLFDADSPHVRMQKTIGCHYILCVPKAAWIRGQDQRKSKVEVRFNEIDTRITLASKPVTCAELDALLAEDAPPQTQDVGVYYSNPFWYGKIDRAATRAARRTKGSDAVVICRGGEAKRCVLEDLFWKEEDRNKEPLNSAHACYVRWTVEYETLWEKTKQDKKKRKRASEDGEDGPSCDLPLHEDAAVQTDNVQPAMQLCEVARTVLPCPLTPRVIPFRHPHMQMTCGTGMFIANPSGRRVLNLPSITWQKEQDVIRDALRILLLEALRECGARELPAASLASLAVDVVERVAWVRASKEGCLQEVVVLKQDVLPSVRMRSFTLEGYLWFIMTPGVMDAVKNDRELELDLNLCLKASAAATYFGGGGAKAGGQLPWTRRWIGREFSDIPLAHFVNVLRVFPSEATSVNMATVAASVGRIPPPALILSAPEGMHGLEGVLCGLEETMHGQTGARSMACKALLPWMHPCYPGNRRTVLSAQQFCVAVYLSRNAIG